MPILPGRFLPFFVSFIPLFLSSVYFLKPFDYSGVSKSPDLIEHLLQMQRRSGTSDIHLHKEIQVGHRILEEKLRFIRDGGLNRRSAVDGTIAAAKSLEFVHEVNCGT
ncbi:hypothetical protein C8R43DRAFT_955550 [Mycena crocata]|nr:hypothetical protein C8R43DRAFT_955550 [Mycena crocata]